MPNESGAWPGRSAFKEGTEMSAGQLRRIIDGLASRIQGGGRTIKVNTFPGGQIQITALGKKGSGGVGGYTVAPVGELPPIPTTGMREVYWDASIEPNTGDNQIWRCYAGQTLWYPTQKTSHRNGAPTG